MNAVSFLREAFIQTRTAFTKEETDFPMIACDPCLQRFLSAGGLDKSTAEAKLDELPGLVVQALAHALDYLREFNLEAVLQQSCAFRPFSQAHEIALSPNALRYARLIMPAEIKEKKETSLQCGGLQLVCKHCWLLI